ncbi:hypothetical protein Hanom_Chr06g00563321 [Helianthus anomalus]
MLVICLQNVIPRRGDKVEVITRRWSFFTRAIGADDKGSAKRHKPFDLKQLGVGWEYKESERYHKLRSEGQRWRALKIDARSLLPGEVDEPESDDEPQGGDDDY